MFRKRFIGVITVKDGLAVQSFSFNKYLPIGDPVILAENFDRWGVDEILVLSIDRTLKNLGPDFGLLTNLKRKALSTPLTFGGGINCLEHAKSVIKLGAERICVDSILWKNPSVVKEISQYLGAQAVIGSLPVCFQNGDLKWYGYEHKAKSMLTETVKELFERGYISEALIIDYINDGSFGEFNLDILLNIPLQNIPLIAFGGMTKPEKIQKILEMNNLVGFGIGNSLSYREHAVQELRKKINHTYIRLPQYHNQCASNSDLC